MRKRLVTQKYLKEAVKYNLKTFISDDKDYYVAVKEYIELEHPVVINELKLIDKGYKIIEVIPKNENYAMRVFTNDKKEILQYYFDIILGSGIDEDTKLPYYDDIYIDVIMTDGEIEISDADELEDAFTNGSITEETYNLAKTTADKVVMELEEKTNKYFNMDLGCYL